MLTRLRTSAHLLNGKISFSRIGVALSLVIIVVAAIVLYRIYGTSTSMNSSMRSKRPIGGRSAWPVCSLPPAT